MARNYMQDITPQPDNSEPVEEVQEAAATMPERSIRDLRPSPARRKLQPTMRPMRDEEYPLVRRRSRIGVWIAAAIALVILLGAGFFILFPTTMVTVVPRTQIISFDTSNPMTAYPQGSASGTVQYTVASQSFEDSAVVAASGMENAEEKASGTVTVFNDYSDQPVRLIKNTRFESAGKIFRINASIDVPGKTSAGPGKIDAQVFADQAGPDYNVPAGDFTVPGLKSSPDMYAKVTAKSSAAMSGGFTGQRPAVSQGVLDAAKAEVRNRLNDKAQQLAATAPEGFIAFPGLMAISYESLPATPEAAGSVRIREKAIVTIPVFAADAFARSVAEAVSADAEGQSVMIRFKNGVSAQPVGTLSVADLGKQPITFSIVGQGQIAWNVDSGALSQALAGREEAAFETIVQGFPAIEEARARLTPFWKHSFPQDPADVKVTVEPAAQF